MKRKSPKDYRRIAKRIVIGILIFTSIFTLLFLLKSSSLILDDKLATNIFADYGQFVGSVATSALTVASIYLLIQTITEGRIVLEEARLTNSKAQVESRFFELLRIHISNRDNVTASIANAFKIMEDEIGEIKGIVKLSNEKRLSRLSENEIDSVSYTIFYFGAFNEALGGDFSLHQANSMLSPFNKNEDGQWIAFILQNLRSKRKILANENEPMRNIYDIFFNGRQQLIGNYFRHMYQTITYIDGQPNKILSYNEKYQYIKTLRAQMSNYEQIIFYFNSRSTLGEAWEQRQDLIDDKKLITKYNLIKNIPVIFHFYYTVKSHYPDVYFESDSHKSKRRIQLESIYS